MSYVYRLKTGGTDGPLRPENMETMFLSVSRAPAACTGSRVTFSFQPTLIVHSTYYNISAHGWTLQLLV